MKSIDKDGNTMITLPVFNILIIINKDGKGGSIHSAMLKTENEDEEDELYNAAMDGIEAMILAHTIAGVDVENSAYLEGIETAVEGCANNL